MTLALDWSERGGPPPRRGRRTGFGTRLIGMVIERQLGGQLDRTFGAEGLDARLTIPLTHERWPQPASSALPEGGEPPLDSFGSDNLR